MTADEVDRRQESGKAAYLHSPGGPQFGVERRLANPSKNTHDISEELKDLSASFLTWKNRESQVSPAGRNRFLFIFN